MTEKLIALDILTDALQLIRGGWNQKLYYDHVSCYCAAGATYAAGSGLKDFWGERPSPETKLAIEMLAEAIGKKRGKTNESTVTKWNDQPGRTQAEVIDLFIRAGARS